MAQSQLKVNTTTTTQLRIEGHFDEIWTKFCNILRYGMNVVIILQSTNEYYRKIISKSARKMDLYHAMVLWNHGIMAS